MRLESIFDDIRTGINVLKGHLRTNPQNGDLIYLTLDDIQNDKINLDGQLKYVASSTLRKFYKRNIKSLSYGDYLLYQCKGCFYITRFEEFDKKAIPSEDFIVLDEALQYFNNAIQDKEVYKYLQEQLRDYEEYYSSKKIFIQKISNIYLEVDKITPSKSPSEFPVYKKKFLNTSDIKIKDEKLTLINIIHRINNDNINLFPEFQRAGNLWTPKNQSRLIESILIDFPIPAFYFDCSNDSNWLVIDGLQRLSTIKNFINDDLELEGLEYLKYLNTKKFSQLDKKKSV
jgi:hypothetical protein